MSSKRDERKLAFQRQIEKDNHLQEFRWWLRDYSLGELINLLVDARLNQRGLRGFTADEPSEEEEVRLIVQAIDERKTNARES
jgi:hypothetical protein